MFVVIIIFIIAIIIFIIVVIIFASVVALLGCGVYPSNMFKQTAMAVGRLTYAGPGLDAVIVFMLWSNLHLH